MSTQTAPTSATPTPAPIRDPVTDSMPAEWTSEQKLIAKDAMAVLLRHYPGWAWQIEFGANVGNQLGGMIIRMGDLPTKTIYHIHPKDIDRDRLRCVVTAGGMLLEAHGLSRTRNRHDEVHGLARTPSGLIVPYADAVPDNNPGFAEIKKLNGRFR